MTIADIWRRIVGRKPPNAIAVEARAHVERERAHIRARACPVLWAAFERHDVSLNTANELIALPRRQQVELVADGPDACRRAARRLRAERYGPDRPRCPTCGRPMPAGDRDRDAAEDY